MKKQLRCVLCQEYQNSNPENNNSNFSIVKDGVPLLEKHYLVIPKSCKISFTELSVEESLELPFLLKDIFKTLGKNTIYIENGFFVNSVSSGTLHEHMHVFAINKQVSQSDLLSGYLNCLKGEYKVVFSHPSGFYKKMYFGYYHVQIPNSLTKFTIYYKKKQDRQVTRKVISNFVNKDNYRYDGHSKAVGKILEIKRTRYSQNKSLVQIEPEMLIDQIASYLVVNKYNLNFHTFEEALLLVDSINILSKNHNKFSKTKNSILKNKKMMDHLGDFVEERKLSLARYPKG